MKKITLLPALLLLCNFVFAGPGITLKGVLSSESKTVDLYGFDYSEEIEVENGEFTFQEDIETGYYTLRADQRIELYLFAGMDMTVSFTENGIEFSGKGAKENEYLQARSDRFGALRPKNDSIYKLDPKAFSNFVDGLVSDEKAKMKSLSGLSGSFLKIENQNLKYDALTMFHNYEFYHAYYADKEGYTAPESIKKRVDISFTSDADYKMYGNYRKMVQRHFLDWDAVGNSWDSLMGVYGNIESPAIKHGLASQLKYAMSPALENMDQVYEGLIALSHKEDFKEDLTELYEVMKTITKGKEAPGFTAMSIDGKNVSLESLRGKPVYIDVWATWCGPCKREIPHLKEVEEKYGKDIHFVSVSIDREEDENTWKKMVEEKELGGIQLMAENDWKSEIATSYAIKGIPRFILVDKDGKIISADAARPSSDDIDKVLEEAIAN